MDKFYIRKGSLQPHYEAVVTDASGGAIDLSSGYAIFNMVNPMTGTIVASGQAEVDSGPGGVLRYPWAAADVSTPGIYKASFEVFSLDGGNFKIPRTPQDEAFVIVLD